jgi:hypothetical protein
VAVAVAAAQGEPREFYCGAGKLASARVPECQSPMRERNAGRRSWGDELVVLAFAVDRARARLPVGEGVSPVF